MALAQLQLDNSLIVQDNFCLDDENQKNTTASSIPQDPGMVYIYIYANIWGILMVNGTIWHTWILWVRLIVFDCVQDTAASDTSVSDGSPENNKPEVRHSKFEPMNETI